jgi:glucose-6-phosphate 1-dehydrogenase
MEPPIVLEADAVRNEKVKLLRALRPIPRRCVSDRVVRAQYAAGEGGGRTVRGYLDEEGVLPDSRTETFVALKAFVDNWRWAGVPFYLRTGKRMPARLTDLSIHFKAVPHVLFNIGSDTSLKPNVLAIRIQPNEGISLQFQVKVPGPAMEIRPFQMDFGYVPAFGKEPPDAYERLLLDAALGDSTLFIRDDEVEAAWSFVSPIVESCEKEKAGKLPTYPAGTWGPREADAFMEADGRHWELMKRPVHRDA